MGQIGRIWSKIKGRPASQGVVNDCAAILSFWGWKEDDLSGFDGGIERVAGEAAEFFGQFAWNDNFTVAGHARAHHGFVLRRLELGRNCAFVLRTNLNSQLGSKMWAPG